MTEQEKREKVIKALECCTKKVCIYKDTEKECPYWELCGEYESSFEDCTTALAKDALALLKAQEARVMTLEYFDNSQDKDSKGCLVVWVEYRRDEEWAEYWEGTCDEWSVIRRDDFYSGESSRFWTSRPTDEQREAIPWN